MSREEEIFAEALGLPEAERAAYLDRVCGADDALRRRLGDLLDAHAESEQFLAGSLAHRLDPHPEEKPGDAIGRYTLLRKLGEGGCGVVYLAEQTEPVRRQVALKIVKLGMDTRQVIARFETERQVLALMDHPGIARVYDAGATSTGRPYFVMEYVDGVPITTYCDAQQLPTAARLTLFSEVCLALQHAHLKGIVHRDVKPSNILVAVSDGRPAPKVIDFGIAKATSGRLADRTLHTAFDQFIGTPAYMSPEQTDLRTPDIDTRSDVYSLGVLLYELLTGQPPFDPKSLIQAGVDEIRRIIREVEPPRPSMVVSTLDAAKRTAVALRRRSGPERLTSVLRGDLDWIVMRCLEKDRTRRYATAHELVDDIHHHLHSEPVRARPPDPLYRAGRFVTRHRVVCGSMAAVFLALAIGAAVSIAQAIEARRARAAALQQQAEAEELLTFMLGDFRTELKKIGRLGLLDAVGEKALAHFAALDPHKLTDAALVNHVKALTQIGEIRLDEARYADATTAFTAAYTRAAALAAREPRAPDPLFARAQAEFWLGFAARRRGDYLAAVAWLTRYRDSTVALVALEGPTPRAQSELTYGHHNLAVLEFDHGNLAAARRGFLDERQALKGLLTTQPGDTDIRYRLAENASWLGSVAEADGDFAEAAQRFGDMGSGISALVKTDHANRQWQFTLAQSAMLLGEVQSVSGHPAEAAPSYARARRLLEALVASDAQNRQWQLNLVAAKLLQVQLLLAGGETHSSVATELAGIRATLDAYLAAEPKSRHATRLALLAWQLEARRRFANGEPATDTAEARVLGQGEALVKAGLADDWTLSALAEAYVLAGRLARARQQPNEAQRDWRRAVELLAVRAATSNHWILLDPTAQALVLLGRHDEARPLIARLLRSGYQPLDPLAASTLGLAHPSVSPIPNH